LENWIDAIADVTGPATEVHEGLVPGLCGATTEDDVFSDAEV
jgi:hypothetical protein